MVFEVDKEHMSATNDLERLQVDDSTKSADEDKRGEGRACCWPELCYCRRELHAVKIFYVGFLAAYRVIEAYTPVFLKQHGLSALEIGVISGIRPALGFLSGPVWGALADRYGIRRFLIFFSLTTWLVVFIGLYAIPEPMRRTECPNVSQPILHLADHHEWRHPDLIDNGSTVPFDIPATNDGDIGVHIAPESSYESLFVDSGDGRIVSSPVCKQMFRANGSLPVGLNSSLCSEEEQELLREDLDWLYEPTSRYHAFIGYLVIICLAEILQSPTAIMIDATLLQILGRERLHEYGAHRAWGAVGWAVSTATTGVLLDFLSWNEVICGVSLTLTDYRIVSLVFTVPLVICFVAAAKINFGSDTPQKPMNEKTNLKTECAPNAHSKPLQLPPKHNHLAVVRFFLNVRNGSLLFATAFSGILNGISPGFVFWHLENIVRQQRGTSGNTAVGLCASYIVVLMVFLLFLLFTATVKLTSAENKHRITPPLLLKRLEHCLAGPLAMIYTQLLSVAAVPDECKQAIITPVFKKGATGGSKALVGIDGIVVSTSMFVSFFLANYVIKLIGHMGVIYLCLFLAVIRFLVFASVTNPWAVLSVSLLSGISYALTWASLSQYTAAAVPSASLASMQGILHGVQSGLGDGIGHFLCGLFISRFGAVPTFFCVAVASAVWLAVFYMCQKFGKEPTDPFADQETSIDNDSTSVASSDLVR